MSPKDAQEGVEYVRAHASTARRVRAAAPLSAPMCVRAHNVLYRYRIYESMGAIS
jgi:hypothetical protein